MSGPEMIAPLSEDLSPPPTPFYFARLTFIASLHQPSANPAAILPCPQSTSTASGTWLVLGDWEEGPPGPSCYSECTYELLCHLVTRSCPAVCYPIDCSPPDTSVHGILQAGILEWVAIPFSRGSSWPRDRTWVSHIAGRFLTTREALSTHAHMGEITFPPPS